MYSTNTSLAVLLSYHSTLISILKLDILFCTKLKLDFILHYSFQGNSVRPVAHGKFHPCKACRRGHLFDLAKAKKFESKLPMQSTK
jgi:hypothetical protein